MHVVNTLEEARAVLAHRQSPGTIELITSPFAACYAGVNYYRKLIEALRIEFPEIPFEFTLDCGDDAAIAHDARRLGFTHIRCSSPLDPAGDTAKHPGSNL